jgi:exopolysaccharide production protein ExoZ
MHAMEQITGHAKVGKRKDLQGIQYLRGLAAMMVVVYHLSLQLNSINGATEFQTLQSGVDVFFVISGFIMMYSTSGGTKITASEFLRRRLVRIAPLYWAATIFIVAMLLFAPQFVKSSKLEWEHASASLAFIAHENPAARGAYIPLVTPGWTLNIEMMFYAVFGCAIWLGSRKPLYVVLIAGVPLTALALLGLAFQPRGIFGFYANPIILEFVYGILIARHTMRNADLPMNALVVGALLLLFVGLLCAPPEGPLLLRSFRYGIPAAAIVFLALSKSVPRWTLLHLLGDASYSIYISHFFVLSAFAQLWRRLGLGALEHGALIFYFLGTTLAIVVGVACWRYIERPLTEVANRLSARFVNRLRPVAA